MDWFKLIYTVVGGLGLFFFGMKLLSESLQAVANNVIQKIINSLTNNRIIAVIVGLSVTCFVQSSSITTVMVVGFVNAGLMTLEQAIGIIMGANIGTTITGWIISIKIGKYSLLFIGLGIFPMLFMKKPKWVAAGKVIFALGLVFLGLGTMSEAFKPLRSQVGFVDALTYFSADSYISILGTAAMGCLLTMIIQSSSGMLGITIALAASGTISFQTGIALVMGENIGTTITALLAGIGTNVHARRAAKAHAVFNILGVFFLSLIFHPYVDFLERIIGGTADFLNPDGSKPYIAAHIAAGHTVFNVTNVVLFLPFLNQVARFVVWMTPEPKEKEPQHLEFLGTTAMMAPSLGIEQANQEIKKFAAMVESMLGMCRTYALNPTKHPELKDKILKYERITDNIQKEITVFLGRVMEAPLTEEQTMKIKSLIRMADELESVADYCENIVKYYERIQSETMDEKIKQKIDGFFGDVIQFYEQVFQSITGTSKESLSDLSQRERALALKADTIRDEFLEDLNQKRHNPLMNLSISDIIVAIRRIKNHTLNLAEANIFPNK